MKCSIDLREFVDKCQQGRRIFYYTERNTLERVIVNSGYKLSEFSGVAMFPPKQEGTYLRGE